LATRVIGAPLRGIAMNDFWYPLRDHPKGSSTRAWFEMLGSIVYPTGDNPEARSTAAPWYQLRGLLAYPVDGHPAGPSPDPSFLLADSLVYPFRDWIVAVAPWYACRPMTGR
jgi:hypothetical protein